MPAKDLQGLPPEIIGQMLKWEHTNDRLNRWAWLAMPLFLALGIFLLFATGKVWFLIVGSFGFNSWWTWRSGREHRIATRVMNDCTRDILVVTANLELGDYLLVDPAEGTTMGELFDRVRVVEGVGSVRKAPPRYL